MKDYNKNRGSFCCLVTALVFVLLCVWTLMGFLLVSFIPTTRSGDVTVQCWLIGTHAAIAVTTLIVIGILGGTVLKPHEKSEPDWDNLHRLLWDTKAKENGTSGQPSPPDGCGTAC
jgi:hypothetical protein